MLIAYQKNKSPEKMVESLPKAEACRWSSEDEEADLLQYKIEWKRHGEEAGNGSYALISLSGKTDPDQMDACLKKLVFDSRWRKGTPTIFDLRMLTFGDTTIGEIQRTALGIAQLSEQLEGRRSAYIYAHAIDEEVVKLYMLAVNMIRIRLQPPPEEVAMSVAKNMEEAPSWIFPE